MYLQILFFVVLKNLSAAVDLPSLCDEYISISLFCKTDLADPFSNSLSISTHILFSLIFDSFKVFCKALVTVILFYLLKE